MTLSTVHFVLLETCLLLIFCSHGFTATLSRDVCKTCHQNATCIEKDNKYSCICNFGLIGNGRTHCLDKDECQMGAHKICGEHTACHNTHGSYYCICLKGYRPSNNHENFIPNDGTFCTDIDECEVPNTCGINGLCKNIPGSFECSCKEGYNLQYSKTSQSKGINVTCQAVNCGQPPVLPKTKIILSGATTYNSQVTYTCISGFYEHGHNRSVCTANGIWEGATLVCTAIDCGPPVAMLNTVIYTFNGTTFGSSVVFMCAKGFIAVSGYNSSTSICSRAGHWEGTNLDCRVADCGPPPSINYTKPDLLWNTTYGSTVNFECLPGFLMDNGNKIATCNENGEWEGGSIVCRVKEDLINNLIIVNETCLQWQKSSEISGWEILYKFRMFGIRKNDKDFVDKQSLNYTTNNDNPVVCLDLLPDTNYTVTMMAISKTLPAIQVNTTMRKTMKQTFGDIVALNNTCLTWTRRSAARSPEVYIVLIQGRIWSPVGSLQSIMFNFTTDKVTPVLCLDLPVAAEYFVNITEPSTELSAYAFINITSDEIENATKEQTFNETCLWWNQSLNGLQEIYKLYIQGERWSLTELFRDLLYKINTDHNTSAKCLDIPMDTHYPINVTGAFSNLFGKEPIQNLTVFNETCLIWRRHHSTKELYVFFIYGYLRNEKSISNQLMFNVTTDERQPVVCFDLQKGINYTVDVVSAFYPQYPVQISIFIPNSDTLLPKLKIVPAHNQLPKINFQRSDRKGPISSYQVFVIQLVHWCSFTCESLEAITYFHNISKIQGYVTAEIFPGNVSDHLVFSVGDRQYYGDFYNAPLEKGKNYCIILRTVTKMGTHSCTVMAHVEELSGSWHHMTVIILGSIAFACFIIFLSYSLEWYCNN